MQLQSNRLWLVTLFFLALGTVGCGALPEAGEPPEAEVSDAGALESGNCEPREEDACLRVVCDEDTGEWVVFNVPNGNICGEGLECWEGACIEPECHEDADCQIICVAQACVAGLCQGPLELSDDNPCTVDFCVAMQGVGHEAVDDGEPCFIDDGDEGSCSGGTCIPNF